MDYDIILASASPRRQELLKGLDLPFRVEIKKGVKETYPSTLQGGEIPLYLSQLKASAYLDSLRQDSILITADTIVWLDNQVLGKPKDFEQAKQMLSRLSGRTHQVFTGVSITRLNPESKQDVLQDSFFAESSVTFNRLTDQQINYYVEHYCPLDKAGAYGVQEWIGYVAVNRIEGSFYNIMGLPVALLYQHLQPLLNGQ